MERRIVIDRRVSDNNLERRQYYRRKRIFYYERTTHLTDTNMMGNVYFAQYFDFMGEAREELLKYLTDGYTLQLIENGIGFSTVSTSLRYISPLYLYDRFRIEMQATRIGKLKLVLSFVFKHIKAGKIIAEGDMTLSMYGPDKRPVVIPDDIRKKLDTIKKIKD